MIELVRLPEFQLSAGSFALLLLYHLWLFLRVRRTPIHTSIGLGRRIRLLWVQTIMAERRDILAVQTLRNWTMAATFLASTAIVIGLGVLNLALTSEKQGQLSLMLDQYGSDDPRLWLGKLLLLGFDFLAAFFSFTLAVRYYNHVGFMINLPPETDDRFTPSAVARILERGAVFYTSGMRAYYLAIPLTLWLFGPLWLLGGVVVLLLALMRLDRGL